MSDSRIYFYALLTVAAIFCIWPDLIWVGMEARSIFENPKPIIEQMIEARENARIGHLTMLNRRACEQLQPGDIVLYDNKLWSVRMWRAPLFASPAVIIVNIDGTNDINPANDTQMAPNKFGGVYKLDTKEWYQAAWVMALQGLSRPSAKK